MSVDRIQVGTEPSREHSAGAIDITGVPVGELDRILRETPGIDTDDVFVERVRDRTYLIACSHD